MFSSAGLPAAAGRQVQLRVRKRAGLESEDVLGTGSGKSVWGKLFGGKQGAITHLLPTLSLRHLQIVLRGFSAPPCTPCNPPAPLVTCFAASLVQDALHRCSSIVLDAWRSMGLSPTPETRNRRERAVHKCSVACR